MLAVLAVSLAITGVASPAPGRAIAVVSVVCDDDPFASTVQGRLASALANAGYQVELDPTPGVSGTRRCGAMARREATQALEDARRLFEEGLRHDAAQLKLEEGLAVLLGAGITSDSELRALLLFYSGWIWLELGKLDDAELQLRRAAGALESFRPDPKRFPPHVLEAFERARQRPQKERADERADPSKPRALLERAVFEGTDETVLATLTRTGEVTIVLAPATNGIVHARLVLLGPPQRVEPLVFTGASLAADLDDAVRLIGPPRASPLFAEPEAPSSFSMPSVPKLLLLGGIGGAALWGLVLVYRDVVAD